MAIAIDAHITTPVAVSSKAPEPIVEVKAPTPKVITPVQHHDEDTDSVKLSLSARIHLLQSQGENTTQIATSLGIDTSTVASYLNPTTTATTASASAPIPTVAVAK